jgi:hypothetical protein
MPMRKDGMDLSSMLKGGVGGWGGGALQGRCRSRCAGTLTSLLLLQALVRMMIKEAIVHERKALGLPSINGIYVESARPDWWPVAVSAALTARLRVLYVLGEADSLSSHTPPG